MIRKVGILGAGTMGAGIAQLCLQNKFPVVLYDAVPESLCAAAGRIKEGLLNAAAKNRISRETAEWGNQNIIYAKGLDLFSSCDLVVEAIIEDLPAKIKILADIEKICPQGVLATNTSSFLVSKVGEGLKNPGRFLGLHFFNPPVAMKLVEMIRTPQTKEKILKQARDFIEEGLKRRPVSVLDTPGFIVNRVMRPYYLESQRAVLEGADFLEIDKAARELGHVPMGPFELMDLIGLDVNLAITKSIYDALGRLTRFQPQPIQERLVALNQLGKKTGRGFYLYEAGKIIAVNPTALEMQGKNKISAQNSWNKIVQSLIREAELVFQEKIASQEDIDLAIRLAMNFPQGPFEWKKENESPL